jgi:hypothetical protein
VYGTCQVNISSNAGQGVQTVDLHHNTIHDPYDPGRHYGVESNNVNNDIRDNEIYNNLIAISCDPSYNTNYTGTLRIYRNWIHDNTERGINISSSGTSSSRNVLAYNNKMKDNGSWEIHLGTVAGNNQFYNNTIYTSAFGFHILSGGTNNIIKNNIVQYTGSGGFYCYQDQNASYAANTEDANIFYRADGGNVVNSGGSSYSASQLAGYRNAANPNGAHTLFSDPLLNSVLTILSNSPAKDEGVNLSAIFTSDYAGVVRPAGAGWDIGAYEYVSADTTPPAPPAGLRIR